MKIKTTLLLVSVIPLLASCAWRSTSSGPEGPRPFAGRSCAIEMDGPLVASDLEGITEGARLGWIAPCLGVRAPEKDSGRHGDDTTPRQ
jgi:hypothetical protein